MRRIAVTGGAGQIAYSLLFHLASGALFGPDTPIALHILELPEALPALRGVEMELQDSAFPLLKEVVIGSDPHAVFEGVEWAFLVGAAPRGPGMERKDLLSQNGAIFVAQGRALNAVASRAVRTLVVGNPCNTNCLIAIHNAPDIPANQFQAMTRLDQNRAMGMLAHKAGRPVSSVTRMAIWGNHSSTQVPDFVHAEIDGMPATRLITDSEWLRTTFFSQVQKRGAEIIAARGRSSAASAAWAATMAMQALIQPTAPNDWFSAGIHTAKTTYPIDRDLVFSFPCQNLGAHIGTEVGGIAWDDFLEQKIRTSERELIEERDLVRALL